MVRSYSIDESIVSQAVKASGDKPVDQVLIEALHEYTRRRHIPQPSNEQPANPIHPSLAEAVKATGNADPKDLIALFGTIDYLPDFDHIAERKRQAAHFHKNLDELDQSESSR